MATWTPTEQIIANANITQWMQELQFDNIHDFQQWTVTQYPEFWQKVINTLPILFQTPPSRLCDLSNGIEAPRWFPNARMNIVDSTLTASPQQTAIIYENSQKALVKMTYAELAALVNQVSNSLVNAGFKAGDAIAIIMPMNVMAVAIYLGVIQMGAVVVSIADSFSTQEIATRLRIANAKLVFTQHTLYRGGKSIALYHKVQAANPQMIIVLPDELAANSQASETLRAADKHWDVFLLPSNQFTSVACDPMAPCNILFSSGTTADPKAIPWNHTTPIKAASDAYFHQNIKTGDILAWPTNLGWMMGPWLLFAAFINRATIALYLDAPKDRAFGEFIEKSRVTMLGVVPTLVATWRQTKCMEGLDWSAINVFSSTGECSNENDMSYLMSLAGGKPVIEYCGGTEIGGAYLSSTVVEINKPAQFSTPTMGSHFTILNEMGITADIGEVAIIPPAIGLSTTLLNANHHHVYFEGMPQIEGMVLRRHGDQIERLADDYYRILGRVDDTMNLGGIKVSAAEIERALIGIDDVFETAAIALPAANQGPNQLTVFAASNKPLDKPKLLAAMQQRINELLNPLFRIHDVIIVQELPKTASNKIMRRLLRDKLTSS